MIGKQWPMANELWTKKENSFFLSPMANEPWTKYTITTLVFSLDLIFYLVAYFSTNQFYFHGCACFN